MKTRNKVLKYWENKYWKIETDACVEDARVIDLGKIIESFNNKEKECKIIDKFSIKFIEDIRDVENVIISETSELLNKYEHLGKYYESGVINDADLKLYFYTQISDTFIACLPFIIYRRTVSKKLNYAEKMEKLTRMYPKLSADWCRM